MNRSGFGGKKMDIHSIDAEDDQFAYRYDTQLLIDMRLRIILRSILRETV